jgi:hypothetical protein
MKFALFRDLIATKVDLTWISDAAQQCVHVAIGPHESISILKGLKDKHVSRAFA